MSKSPCPVRRISGARNGPAPTRTRRWQMSTTTRRANATLWIVQSLLAALFLYAGGFKLVTPLAALAKMSPFPAPFLRFVGICEVAGALGLILPGLLGIKRALTPLAATGLVGI